MDTDHPPSPRGWVDPTDTQYCMSRIDDVSDGSDVFFSKYGENNGKPYYIKMDDLRGNTHYFRKHPCLVGG